jgi:ribonuclease HI
MIISLYTDGGVIGRNPSDIGGTWAWCGVDETGTRVLEESGRVQAFRPITNNHTEQIAIVKALEAMPEGWTGKLYTDSFVAMVRVFFNGKTRNLPINIIERTQAAVKRLGKVKPVLIAGHPNKSELANGIGRKGLPVSEHNVWCDNACKEQAKEIHMPQQVTREMAVDAGDKRLEGTWV